MRSCTKLFVMYLFSDPNMLNEINWSKQLEEVFKDNRKSYPEIYWQSFGSQKGMLRIYPLARLVLDYKNNVYSPSYIIIMGTSLTNFFLIDNFLTFRWETPDDLPDLFDVRRRPWYIHGTSSPKDVVILLDR